MSFEVEAKRLYLMEKLSPFSHSHLIFSGFKLYFLLIKIWAVLNVRVTWFEGRFLLEETLKIQCPLCNYLALILFGIKADGILSGIG